MRKVIRVDQDSFVIRPLHPDDASSLYELFREPSPLTCDYFEPDADLAWYNLYTEKPAGDVHRLVAIRGNRLLGLGILERLPRARLAHVGRLRLLLPVESFISDAGAELLTALVDLADNWLNLGRLEAECPVSVPMYTALLQRSGFEVEGIMRKRLGPGPDFDDEITLARLRGSEDKERARRPLTESSRRSKRSSIVSESVVRPMEAGDIESLYDLFRAPENCRTTLQLPSQELGLTRQRVLEPPAGMIRLVADYGGRVIGMISLRRREQACRVHCGGIGMMVHPDFWDQGVGSRLLEEVLSLADRELQLTRIELQVHTDNVAGIRLYEKYGFAIEGTKRLHTYGAGGWADTYFMARING